jgi:hypothetical protein
MVYAIATTDNPNAIAVPITLLGTSISHPKLTAAPQPISTSTIVPIISAKYFFILLLTFLIIMFFNCYWQI